MTAAAYRVALENSYLGTWAVLPVTLSLLLIAATAGLRRAACLLGATDQIFSASSRS